MRFLSLICTLAFVGNLPALALSVSPTRIVVGSDIETQAVLRLEAEREAMAVEVIVVERIAGGDLVAVAEDTVRVSPPQLLIDRTKPRNIRIEIAAGIARTQSRAFYLRIEQLGLRAVSEASEGEQDILLLPTYLLPIHVLGGHEASLVGEILQGPEGTQVQLTNTGQGSALLTSCTVALIRQDLSEIELEGRRLAEPLRSDAVLPGETIRFYPEFLLDGDTSELPLQLIGVRTTCDQSL